jgi:predicted Zn finger-like uncharacterized protein
VNIACRECDRVYRIDPDRVPEGGARTRCAECGVPFLVMTEPDALRPGVVVTGLPVPPPSTPAPSPPPTPEPPKPTARPEPQRASPPAPQRASPPAPGAEPPKAPVFGPQDPQTRARRLARALISDIKVYNRDRWEQSRSTGTLRKDFREEIVKSWEEYVEQVGDAMAKQTPYFRDALNDILAAGERVF